MKHYTLYNIHKATRTLLLTAGLLMAGGVAWGQRISEDVDPASEITEILYIKPSTREETNPKTIKMQTDDDSDKLDGYIRWYTENADGNKGVTGLVVDNNSELVRYSNGYAWRRTNNDLYPSDACSMTFRFTEEQIENGITLVFEASSEDATVNGGGNNRVLTPKAIGVRHKYIIKNANERSTALYNAKTAFDKLGDVSSNINALLNASNKSACVLHTYTIHTPIQNGTNYRLPERLDNYYVGTTNPQVVQHVRWTMYGADGSRLDQENGNANILAYKFPIADLDTTVSHKRYILTEVSANETDWYPVSLLNIILEPFSLPLTEGELNGFRSNPNYKDRFEDSLMVDGRYELLENISFEDKDDKILTEAELEANPSLNYREDPLIAESYYAFADPENFANKKQSRLSVGRGEYALYRTLNYDDISKRGKNYNGGVYYDYFPTDRYDIAVVDRLNEKTKGSEFGYFMYLDAADEPGVITKIPLDNLCANTSLIVSAWICELAHGNPAEDSRAAHADVGFTFKRIDYTDDGDSTEVILTKYYTGALSNKPGTTENYGVRIPGYALWQQVSFKFSFSNDEISNDDRSRYILEISNNCPESNGADYGIDEIKVYRSLPNIDVQRKDACDASTLIVSSSYETLLHNMGWDLDPDILIGLNLDSVGTRKYRYGLMGDDPNADIESINAHVGNVYYGFVEDTTKSGADPDTWITVNKDPDVAKLGLSKSIRVAVPTKPGEYITTTGGKEGLPNSREKALEAEITMNLRAINDYNADTKRGPEGSDEFYWPNATEIDISELKNTDGTLKEPTEILNDATLLNLYEDKILELYSILHIPRIRCPWTEDGGKTICLSAIDVDDTDLKFWNELIEVGADGNNKYASGKYFVVLFSAADILGSNNLTSSVVNLQSRCTLISEFYVLPSIRIVVNTKTETGGVTCIGEIHNMDAHLTAPAQDEYGNIIDDKVMEDLEKLYPNTEYTFDWFLGPETEYLKVLDGVEVLSGHIDLKSIIADLRSDRNLGGQPITEVAIDAASTSKLNDSEKQLLKRLLNEGKLLTGKQVSFQFMDQIVAMPYVYTKGTSLPDDEADKLYCTDAQVVDLPTQSNVPELSVGFPGVQYAESWTVPLRLGLPNIRSGKTLANIPIQNEISFGMTPADGHCLKHVTTNDTIFLVTNSADPAERYIPVARLTNLYADDDETDDKSNVLSLAFNNALRTGETLNWSDVFGTEQIYSLLIPFGEYENATASNPIQGSCMGYARLLIKIVPEYLTWKGEDTGSWYSDNVNWHRSTEGEIFLDASGQSAEDANGYSYPMSAAFSPLYFTKITIPDSKQLVLQNEEELRGTNDGVLSLDAATDSIAYDMAVDSVSADQYKIVPYYGNKVSEIYFKPNATLMNQHYLTYDTARVEFTMMQDSSYWMASPLKAVYAGDMYTLPDGIQNTPAFDYITYQEGTNSRWNPAFYQKAWDKAVAYAVSNSDDGTAVKDTGRVAAVKSNWSIEYNDVWIPYTLGKGFYARVEGMDATVRLPKADLDYKYEPAPATRAAGPELSGKGDRTGAGEMADGADMKITLEASVDGDGTHYLVGNPYMTYLDMKKFFVETNNESLQKKYWKLDREKGIEAIVGTPDVGWTGTETESGLTISGFIAPMEAFFVEVDPVKVTESTPAVVNFNTSMMATKEQATATSSATRSVSATAPVLTLTADRNGKKGRSVITLRDKASNTYQPQEDAVVLLDSELDAPVAYSVAGNRAAQVNALRSIDNVPVGVYSSREGDVTVTIEGMDQLAEPLYLYDAHTRKSTLLEGDSYTLELSGESHGRYYLRSSAIGSVGDNAIAVYSVQSGKVIVSSTQEVRNIKVYSLSGAMVKNYMNLNTTQYTFNLSAGVYVVHAEGRDDTVKVEKVMVR